MKKTLKDFYFNYLWWIWQTFLVLACGFFLVLGIQLLIHAYKLDNPFPFMMIFFSSNLIILISAVLGAGLSYRMFGVYRLINKKKKADKEAAE
jgi:hypothetical protein